MGSARLIEIEDAIAQLNNGRSLNVKAAIDIIRLARIDALTSKDRIRALIIPLKNALLNEKRSQLSIKEITELREFFQKNRIEVRRLLKGCGIKWAELQRFGPPGGRRIGRSPVKDAPRRKPPSNAGEGSMRVLRRNAIQFLQGNDVRSTSAAERETRHGARYRPPQTKRVLRP